MKSSSKRPKDRLPKFVILPPGGHLESTSSLLMTTPGALHIGSRKFSMRFIDHVSRECLDQQLYLHTSGVTGTYSGFDGSSYYAIDFLLMGTDICLVISRRQVLGPQERPKKPATIRAKSTFLKRAIWHLKQLLSGA